MKLFAWLTELSWSDAHDTCVSSRHLFLAQKSAKITEYRDTTPEESFIFVTYSVERLLMKRKKVKTATKDPP